MSQKIYIYICYTGAELGIKSSGCTSNNKRKEDVRRTQTWSIGDAQPKFTMWATKLLMIYLTKFKT